MATADRAMVSTSRSNRKKVIPAAQEVSSDAAARRLFRLRSPPRAQPPGFQGFVGGVPDNTERSAVKSFLRV